MQHTTGYKNTLWTLGIIIITCKTKNKILKWKNLSLMKIISHLRSWILSSNDNERSSDEEIMLLRMHRLKFISHCPPTIISVTWHFIQESLTHYCNICLDLSGCIIYSKWQIKLFHLLDFNINDILNAYSLITAAIHYCLLPNYLSELITKPRQ